MDRRLSNSSSVTSTKRNVSRNRHISSKGIRQQSVLKRQFTEKSVKIAENDQITEYDKLPDAECDKMSAESQSEDSIPEETRELTQETHNSDRSIMVR